MAKESRKKADPYVIKRYANRKLYDTVQRQFTTLDQLGVLVENGAQLIVTEHDTGEDRTSDVLAQVLGRRIKAGSGDTAALGELLRTPAEAATSLAGGLLGSLVDTRRPAPKKTAKGSKSGKPKDSKGTKATKKPAKAASAEQDELLELRKQVSELTSVVHLLLQDRAQPTD